MNGKEKFKKFRIKHRDALLALALLAIPIGWWLLISGYPTGFGLVLGFLDWKGINATPKLTLDNFKVFFTNSFYYSSLFKTVLIGGLSFVATTLIGLLFALVLNKIKVFRSVFQAIWYIPVVLSTVATTQIFNIFLDTYDGVINQMLIRAGKEIIVWELSVPWSIAWIVIYSVWKGLGGSVLLWLSALLSVDGSLKEAAKIDGATLWKEFIYVTVPQMKPIILYILINGFIGAMQIYEQVLFITNGGPYGQTEVLAFRIMRDFYWENNFGMAGASSMVMLLVTFGFTVAVFKTRKEKE